MEGPSIVNIKHHDEDEKPLKYDVYVGREYGDMEVSKWANPFPRYIYTNGKHAELWEEYFWSTPELFDHVQELKGKTLACWCKPDKCHADMLLTLANMDEETLEEEKRMCIIPLEKRRKRYGGPGNAPYYAWIKRTRAGTSGPGAAGDGESDEYSCCEAWQGTNSELASKRRRRRRNPPSWTS